MKSNKTTLLTAMVHHVCKGEVEFHDICEILKVSLSVRELNFIILCVICRHKLSMKS